MTKQAEQIEYYRQKIKEISERCGYNSDVTLLAATKTVSADIINLALSESGLRDIGENRVQELLEKYDALNKENLNIHFIGSLQSNKVKYIIDKVCMIQSLDSLTLANEIDRQAKKHDKIMDVLIEINIGEERNKGGILPADLDSFIDSVSSLENMRIKGIMTIAPKCENSDERIGYFKKTYEIYTNLALKRPYGIDFSLLSMGMTDSFEEAISCGSNMVRIGSGIFGKRQAKPNV